MDGPNSQRDPAVDMSQLANSVHSAQAQGLLRQPDTVAHLLRGIEGALRRTVEGNAGDPQTAWALRSDTCETTVASSGREVPHFGQN